MVRQIPRTVKARGSRLLLLRPDGSGKATLTLEALSGASVLAVQVAIDRNNGFQLVAVGTTIDSPDGANAPTTAASGHKWGRFYTEWSDPFYIPVSTDKTWIDWYYSGGTVDSFTAGAWRNRASGRSLGGRQRPATATIPHARTTNTDDERHRGDRPRVLGLRRRGHRRRANARLPRVPKRWIAAYANGQLAP